MLFGLMNLLLITGANLWIFSPKADFPDEWRSGMYMVAFGAFFLHLLVIGCAVGFRYIVRWGDMQMRLKEELGLKRMKKSIAGGISHKVIHNKACPPANI